MAAAGFGGQTINDRLLSAKHSLAGQGLAKAVCKATTEELLGPKRKHLDYLLRCTEEPNVSIPNLANLLLERTQHPNWIVVFKALVTIHHLMCYGNEKFLQYIASSNCSFELNQFLDKGGIAGFDMSAYVQRYAKYLSQKSYSYRSCAFDFCKVKRGKEGGTLRQFKSEKLLKTLTVLQDQVDALVAFEASMQDLNNGVINAAFMLLFRDLIRLFACYNDGIINLLEKYFEMNRKHAKEALDIYKSFLLRMDKVGEFMKVAEKFGIDKSDIPDLAKAPSSLLEALESHLANLEGRKPGEPAKSSKTAGASHTDDKQKYLADEEKAMEGYKKAEKKPQQPDETNLFLFDQKKSAANPNPPQQTNPFAAAASFGGAEETKEETPNILDLFGVSAPVASGGGGAPANNLLDFTAASGNPFGQPAADTSILQPGLGSTNGASGGGMGAAAANKQNLVTGDLDASLANLTTNLNLTTSSS